jgi:hypothetical protein
MSSFREKVEKLSGDIQAKEEVVRNKEKCIPTIALVGIVVPFIILAILALFKPKIVQKKDGETYVRDPKRIFYWTVGLTIVVWLCMYLFSYFKGYSNMSMSCVR